MKNDEIRIGIVGAGQITRARHFPGFRAIPGVRVVGVCNRRRETAAESPGNSTSPRSTATGGTWSATPRSTPS